MAKEKAIIDNLNNERVATLKEFNLSEKIQEIKELFDIDDLVFTKKLEDGTPDPKWIGGRCNFECFYYTYKMNLHRDIVFLE